MAAPPRTTASEGGGGNVLTQKLGPLATWVWLLIGTVLVVLYYVIAKWKSGKTTPAAASSTAPTTNQSQVPDYIVQNYLGNTPSGSSTPPPATSTTATTPPPTTTSTATPPASTTSTAKTAPPPSPAVPAAPKPAAQQYTVVTVVPFADPAPWNSTLWGIATHYNVPGGYQALAKLNNISDPNLIHPGQQIRVPT